MNKNASVFEIAEEWGFASTFDMFILARRTCGRPQDASASEAYKVFMQGGPVPHFVNDYIQYKEAQDKGFFVNGDS